MFNRQLLTEGGVSYGPPSLYAILGVALSAPNDIIKQAYRSKVFQHHPDRNPNDPSAAQTMIMINQAYATLSDPIKRKDYDQRIGNVVQVRQQVAPNPTPAPQGVHPGVVAGPPLPRPPSQFDRNHMAQRGYQVCAACQGIASRRVYDPSKGETILSPCRTCGGLGFVLKKKSTDW